MRRYGMPDVGGEDQHQARARKDLDVIAITHGGQVCIEARIVEYQHSVARLEIVFAVGRIDGLSILNRRAGIIDADQAGVVIVSNRRLSAAHAVAEEQKIDPLRSRDSLGLQPLLHPCDEHGPELFDCKHGVCQTQQIQRVGVCVGPVVDLRLALKQIAPFRGSVFGNWIVTTRVGKKA
jgi:hypothetical protein